MSITPIVQVIEDGPRNFIVRLACELTGGSTESAVTKITLPMAAAYNLGPVTSLALEGFQGATTNIAVRLLWEGTPNSTIWEWPANFAGRTTFRDAGPIKNNATLATGCVLLSAENYSDPILDGRYDLTLWFKKRYN